MLYSRVAKITTALLLASLLLVACKSENVGETQSPTLQDSGTSEVLLNPALSRSTGLAVATDEIDSLFNPLNAQLDYELWLVELLFDGLFEYDATGEITPALAENYQVSEDGLIYTVALKRGVTFHNEMDLTASDVVFTYDYLMTEGYQGEYSNIASLLSEVIDLDQNTIQITFKERNILNPKLLTIPILSQQHYKAHARIGQPIEALIPVGTGLYKFDKYIPQERLTLIKNSLYWKSSVTIPSIVIRELDQVAALEAFTQGGIDMFKLPRDKSYASQIKALNFGNILVQDSDLITFVGMNIKSPTLFEPEVRKALELGLDKDLFILNHLQGYASRLDFLPISITEIQRFEQNQLPQTYNVEAAKKQLDEIGWIDSDGDGIRDRNGEVLTFKWHVYADVDWPYQLSEQALSNWSTLGIKVDIVYTDYLTLLQQLASGDIPDMWCMGWKMDWKANPAVLFGILESENFNYTGYDDIVANQIFNALNLSDSGFREETLFAQWHILQRQSSPYIPIARLKSAWAYNSRVKYLTIDQKSSWVKNVHLMEVETVQ